MLHRPHHHHLIAAKLKDLRPTQIAVGFIEVAEKRKQWLDLAPKKRKVLLASHVFPCVLGPKQRYYVVDHHHLGLALLAEAVQSVWLTVLDDISWLTQESFWRTMEFHGWAHPYDASGRRREYTEIPIQLQDLQDDPYRSLAAMVRTAGGYAKDSTPFAEFLWADYFRPQIGTALIGKQPKRALKKALHLAGLQQARYLPGWTGVIETD